MSKVTRDEESSDKRTCSARVRPKSETIKNPTLKRVSSLKERPQSETAGRRIRRHVSFSLDHNRHGNEEEENSRQKQEEVSHIKKPVIRQCSFQHNQRQHENHELHETPPRSPNKKKSLADMLPELMKKFKSELGCKSFIVNTRKAVERRRQLSLETPQERQWMKGSDMQAFYHTWQTSDDHVKDQSVRPSTVRRNRSLPKDYRMSAPVVADTRKSSKKDEFGIVRECCSHPRMRIPSFKD